MLCSPEMVLTRFAGCRPHSASSAISLTATFVRLTATGFENTIMKCISGKFCIMGLCHGIRHTCRPYFNRRQCPMVSAQQTITYESCWI
ncbi:hypothetical protein K450DRAFT_256443 [Umbelopsis ramanniana AG]|uniref:Uncharacterized protein n=1 Tax=Umbelopsis ramanniana AG TaxID=1314678 RepID=A0AAD5HA29_UMBRA|nr:uncharacterized protein K450DRAFT_256443 [Umbelopsis ramanniana AG]KAI8576497.1 hypothetical protein K450DRAFT_256443 [Umbelopsis ramanniana AG]